MSSTVSNVISLLFSGLVIGAVIFYCLKKSEDPAKLLFKFILTIVIVAVGISIMRGFPHQYWPMVALVFGLCVAVVWAPTIGGLVARPFTNLFSGGSEPPEPAPLYSIAESKRNLSQFDEAIRLIRAQLEKFPGDYTGMMLIATIQAEDLNDMQAAQSTIEHLLADQKRPPQAAATALHALADWHLRLEDPDSARAALQRIIDKFPDSPISQIASQRIARIGTKAEITAMRHQGPIVMRVGEKNIGLRTDIKPVAEADPGEIAAGYVRQLEKFPLDAETREKLALLYLDHFQRPDLALDQFEQLAAQPNETPRRISRWLNFVATVHLRRNDLPAAEEALRKIIEKYPDSAPAQMALERLPALEGELKGKASSSSIKLGHYDHNIGLKPNSSPKLME